MAPVTLVLDRSTIVRVSIITALGFMVAALSATYLDGVLSTHVVFHRVRTYPMGYWILLALPAFFLAPYVALERLVRAPVLAAWLPASLLAIPFLWNFRPELPHAGFVLDIGSYEVLAFVTVVIRQAAALPASVTQPSLSSDVRIRRLEEAIKDWRAALFLAATTGIVAHISWVQFAWNLADRLATNKTEQWIAGNTFGLKTAVFATAVFLGPLWELFRALRQHQDYLITIEKGASEETSPS